MTARIVIADDQEILREGVKYLLARARPEWEICGEAVDGRQAVDMTLALRPDLVILDISMPKLNGLSAVRQILRNRPQTQILVFTVHESEQTVREIHAAGAQQYLPKGKGSDDLLRVVRELLDGKKPASAAVAGSQA